MLNEESALIQLMRSEGKFSENDIENVKNHNGAASEILEMLNEVSELVEEEKKK